MFLILKILGSVENIHIGKDYNLEHDPYFYRRQRELHQIRDDIKSGKTEMISHDDFWDEIDSYAKEHHLSRSALLQKAMSEYIGLN